MIAAFKKLHAKTLPLFLFATITIYNSVRFIKFLGMYECDHSEKGVTKQVGGFE